MSRGLIVEVGGLAGRPGTKREFSGSVPAELRIGDSSVDGPLQVEGAVVGTADGVIADFKVSGTADYQCVRCLTEWSAPIEVEASQHFSKVPDEDGHAIVDGAVDVGTPARDELALAVPLAPVCQTGCKGLCPICGTDLNSEPCEGHGDDSDSPFAALRDLFDS